MGHHLNAIVGARDVLSSLIEWFGSPEPVGLPFDLLLVILDEDRMDEIALSLEPPLDGFTFLNPKIADEIARATERGRALYFETDYFGGTGGQGAALFEDGALIWRRAEATVEGQSAEGLHTRRPSGKLAAARSPISEGLASLGVTPQEGQDEFDAVGLGRFRTSKVLRLREKRS